MNRRIRSLLALWVTAGLGGCICTEVNCEDEVVVTLLDGRALGEGTFTVTTTSGGASSTCTVTTSFDGSFGPDDVRCEGDGVLYATADGTWSVRLDVIDREAPGGTVSVAVSHGGTRLIEALDVPYTLESYQPNGPDCPPTCVRAEIEIAR